MHDRLPGRMVSRLGPLRHPNTRLLLRPHRRLRRRRQNRPRRTRQRMTHRLQMSGWRSDSRHTCCWTAMHSFRRKASPLQRRPFVQLELASRCLRGRQDRHIHLDWAARQNTDRHYCHSHCLVRAGPTAGNPSAAKTKSQQRHWSCRQQSHSRLRRHQPQQATWNWRPEMWWSCWN